MRKVYLIRHGMPDLPEGVRMCLGRTDLPLGTLGKLQGVLLGQYMKSRPFTQVYSSPLRRAFQTAQYLGNPVIVEDLQEMAAGDWDGLSFDDIRRRWPDIYEKRGKNPNLPIPGAEPVEQGQQRFLTAVRRILEEETGDIAIVAHATVIQSFISFVLGTDVRQCRSYKLGHTSITTVQYSDGIFSLERQNELPYLPPDRLLCEQLLQEAGAPLDHCREVAEKALRIAGVLDNAGIRLNAEAIELGALLHDIARSCPDHPDVGARWLTALGWPSLADLVKTHHDPANSRISEANIIFLADKLPVEDRFARSLSKCTTPEAREAHDRRYRAALTLKKEINSLCGKEIIL